jgi:DNA (cytosine-5)-methyltransferase 1
MKKVLPGKQLVAVGITCGIGSMLIGARDAGFRIEGNVEWRQYYHDADVLGQNTFDRNFPGAAFPSSVDRMTEEEFRRFSNPDLALGHPECGNFSQLSGANRNRQEKLFDPADIPLFVALVAKLKPRFFVMDDLPRSFMAYPMSKYAEKLPDYDLFPEWVSNWGYGNVQKGRKRMFMLGALRAERWAFRPGEEEHGLLVSDAIGDLPEPRRGSNVPNQDPHDDALDCFRALNLGTYRKKSTWAEVREYFLDKRGGFTLEYPTEDGRVVKRIGFLKGHWDGPSHVLTGGNAILHNQRCQPYTIRERARIQGFPDDFVFYGTVLNDRGEWNHDTNSHMVKQTGKAMPVQFCRYVSRQVAAKIKGEEFTSSGRRVMPPNEHVDAAKRWYCQEVGYSDQGAACSNCWMARRCEIRTGKYGIGVAATATPDAAVATAGLRNTRKRTANRDERTVERTPHSASHKVASTPRARGVPAASPLPDIETEVVTFGED